MNEKVGTGAIKVRFFSVYQSIITLVTIMRLHYGGVFFQSIMKDMVSGDLENAVNIFVEKLGESYTLYLTEKSFEDDADDGREVMEIGGEYKLLK